MLCGRLNNLNKLCYLHYGDCVYQVTSGRIENIREYFQIKEFIDNNIKRNIIEQNTTYESLDDNLFTNPEELRIVMFLEWNIQ